MAINYNPRTVTDGLILFLDAANQYSYSGIGTSWNDLSSRRLNSVIAGNYTYTFSNGIPVFDFNGTNGYAYVPGYKGITGTAGRTSIILFRTNLLNPAAPAHRLLGWGSTSTGAKWNISFDATNFRLRAEAAGAFVICNSGVPTVDDMKWHMVATTAPANGTVNDIRIYIDGNLITDVSITNGSTAINTASNNDISFGASLADASPGYINANISMVQIYDRALSASEIQQNFSAVRGRFGI